jgi:fatty acyl-CoA reductase
MGETLREGTHLDIVSELNLIKGTLIELNKNSNSFSEKTERRIMKELGLKRSDKKTTSKPLCNH